MTIANLKSEAFFSGLVGTKLLVYPKRGVVTNPAGKILGTLRSNGYFAIGRYDTANQCYRQISIHRLIWVACNGLPSDPTLQINHLDGNKTNNSIFNLELVTYSENAKHSHRLGLQNNDGENNSQAIFGNKTVVRLRKKFAAGLITIPQIMQHFDCSYSVVRNMLTGKHYPKLNAGTELECLRLIRANAKTCSQGEKVVMRCLVMQQ